MFTFARESKIGYIKGKLGYKKGRLVFIRQHADQHPKLNYEKLFLFENGHEHFVI